MAAQKRVARNPENHAGKNKKAGIHIVALELVLAALLGNAESTELEGEAVGLHLQHLLRDILRSNSK